MVLPEAVVREAALEVRPHSRTRVARIAKNNKMMCGYNFFVPRIISEQTKSIIGSHDGPPRR